MSTSIILIILIIIIGLYLFFKNRNNKKEKDFNETKRIAQEIKEKLIKGKINNQKDFMNGKGVSKNGGGIIKERVNKPITNLDRKPNAWKETSSPANKAYNKQSRSFRFWKKPIAFTVRGLIGSMAIPEK